MELHLIRHAQPFNDNLPDGAGRQCDPPLTEVGWQQAERVGQYLVSGAARCPDTRPTSADGFGPAGIPIRLLSRPEHLPPHLIT